MSRLIRVAGTLGLLLVVSVPTAWGANQKDIDRSLKAGVESIKTRYTSALVANEADHGIGPACASRDWLCSKPECPADDPVVKKIIARVRDESYTQTKTYRVALCLMFLDRLGDPADEPLIQSVGGAVDRLSNHQRRLGLRAPSPRLPRTT